jgi:hypothetical protein
MLSVPPDTGFVLLVDVDGAVPALLLLELVELGVLDELEHAARPPAAIASTASAATRFEALGMVIFLLVFSDQVGSGRPSCGTLAMSDHCLPTERFCVNSRGIPTKMQVVARL